MQNSNKELAEEIIKRSGNSFHSKVVKQLRESGWGVLVSPHYSDNFTDKPREIDIIAEKKFDVDEFIYGWLGTVNVRLFIECKYVNGNNVFWFDAKDKDRAAERIMRDTGMEDLQRDLSTQKHHYYSDAPVAKLFSSDKGRSEDNEMMSKAINQNLNATVYYRNKGDLNLIKTSKGYIERVLNYLSYPIIVVNSFDHFYSTDMDGSCKATPITEPFQLEVNYAYTDKEINQHSEYFIIDVVSLDKLPDFLSSVIEGVDVSAIKKKIGWDKSSNQRANRTSQQKNFE